MFSNSKKVLFAVFAILALWLITSPALFAADVIPTQQGPYSKAIFAVGAMIAAGLAIGLGCIGSGSGIGNATASACEAVGRNPGVQGKVMMTMMIGMALCESIAIYALVIAFILLFANPLKVFLLS